LDLKFHFKGDGQSAGSSQHPWSIYMSATSGTFDSQFTAENNTFWAENEKKNESEKCTFGRKRNWPKPPKIPMFGAENETEIWSVSTSVVMVV